MHRHGLGVQAAHAEEQGVLEEAAVRDRGQAPRLGDGEEVLVAVEDREAERDGRLLPRRPPPDERLPGPQDVHRQGDLAVEPHLAPGDPLPPGRLGRVTVALRQPGEDRAAGRLRSDLLPVLEARRSL